MAARVSAADLALAAQLLEGVTISFRAAAQPPVLSLLGFVDAAPAAAPLAAPSPAALALAKRLAGLSARRRAAV